MIRVLFDWNISLKGHGDTSPNSATKERRRNQNHILKASFDSPPHPFLLDRFAVGQHDQDQEYDDTTNERT